MSFDIFIQRFDDGPSAEEAAAVRSVLEPIAAERDGNFARLRTSDGEAEIYGSIDEPDHFMVNHASGRDIWDVIFAIADAGGFAIMPIGCSVLVTDAEMIATIPSPLVDEVRVVASGPEIIEAIETC